MVRFFARGQRDGRRPRALILVENAPVPEDRRVTAEAQSLLANGYDVSVICPTTGDQPLREDLDGVLVARYRPYQPPCASGGAREQVTEYVVALARTLRLMAGLARSPGFDVIQACNPPDLFFADQLAVQARGQALHLRPARPLAGALLDALRPRRGADHVGVALDGTPVVSPRRRRHRPNESYRRSP